jgi:hypothetical protein
LGITERTKIAGCRGLVVGCRPEDIVGRDLSKRREDVRPSDSQMSALVLGSGVSALGVVRSLGLRRINVFVEYPSSWHRANPESNDSVDGAGQLPVGWRRTCRSSWQGARSSARC